MLGTILGILKIIGIVILIILLIIIALLLIVLFVPIRYKAHVRINRIDLSDENIDFKQQIKADAGFHWLLYLVRGGIGYPDNTSFWLKVLFFKILPSSKKKDKEDSEDTSSKDSEEVLETESDGDAISDKGKDDEPSDDLNNDASSDNEDRPDNDVSSDDEDRPDNDDSSDNANCSDNEALSDDEDLSDNEDTTGNLDSENGQDDISGNDSGEDLSQEDDEVDIFTIFDFIEKLIDLVEGVFDFLEKPEKAVEKALYTISRACDKIDLIQNTLESPTFERAYRCAKKDLFLILRHIMPRKIDADILLGLGDPATTAQVLAGVGVINTLNDYDIWMEPDFENKVVESTVDISGRIALWRLLLSAARVYFNKDIRKVRKRFNRILSK